jgi:Rab proteins geranylgeranyltransferase component A
MVLPSSLASPSTVPTSSPVPLFTTFYIHHPDLSTVTAPESFADSAADRKPYIIPPPLSTALPLPDIPDAAATHAEAVFWETVKTLRGDGVHPMQASVMTHTSEDVPVIESFWPTIDVGEETEDEE